MRRFTDSDVSYIRMMYRQAKDPQKQIGILADLYVCTKNDIRKVLGLPDVEQRQKRQYIRWTPKLDNWLLELRRDGKTSREIAELMGITKENVRQRAFRLRAEEKNPPAAWKAASGKRTRYIFSLTAKGTVVKYDN